MKRIKLKPRASLRLSKEDKNDAECTVERMIIGVDKKTIRRSKHLWEPEFLLQRDSGGGGGYSERTQCSRWCNTKCLLCHELFFKCVPLTKHSELYISKAIKPWYEVLKSQYRDLSLCNSFMPWSQPENKWFGWIGQLLYWQTIRLYTLMPRQVHCS